MGTVPSATWIDINPYAFPGTSRSLENSKQAACIAHETDILGLATDAALLGKVEGSLQNNADHLIELFQPDARRNIYILHRDALYLSSLGLLGSIAFSTWAIAMVALGVTIAAIVPIVLLSVGLILFTYTERQNEIELRDMICEQAVVEAQHCYTHGPEGDNGLCLLTDQLVQKINQEGRNGFSASVDQAVQPPARQTRNPYASIVATGALTQARLQSTFKRSETLQRVFETFKDEDREKCARVVTRIFQGRLEDVAVQEYIARINAAYATLPADDLGQLIKKMGQKSLIDKIL